MRISALVPLTFFLAAACATGRVDTPRPLAEVPTVTAAADRPVPQEAEAIHKGARVRTAEIVIARPTDVACSLASKSWSGSLQLRDGGASFASLASADATLVLPRVDGAAAVEVRGPIDITAVVSDPRVYLAKPMALGDFAVPLASTALDLAAPHEEGSMNVGLDVSDMFEAPSAVRQVVPCSALTAVESSYDASAFVHAPSSIPVAVVPFTDLRATPRGPIVAKIAKTPRGNIRVGASHDGARRLVLEGRGYLATGWVPADSVQARDLGYGTGSGRLGAARYMRSHAARCAEPIDVYAQIDGERARIGVMRAGTRYVRDSVAEHRVPDGFVAIELADHWLTMNERALLLIASDDAARCQRR